MKHSFKECFFPSDIKKIYLKRTNDKNILVTFSLINLV